MVALRDINRMKPWEKELKYKKLTRKNYTKDSLAFDHTLEEIALLIMIVLTLGLIFGVGSKKNTEKSYIHPLFKIFDKMFINPSYDKYDFKLKNYYNYYGLLSNY